MATNYKSTVGQIAEEVATLLRHDNLDARIYSWIGMTYADVLQRFPLEYFQEMLQDTVADTTKTDELATDDNVGTPMALITQNASNKLYCPTWVTPAEYSRVTVTSSQEADSTVIRLWTIMKNASNNDAMFVYPGSSGGHTTYLFHIPPGLSAVPATADYLSMIPYHLEDIVIWGAAYYGALVVRAQAAKVYKMEYEEALQDFAMLVGYQPDATPTMRSLDGAYAGFPQHRGAQFPEQIS